MLEMICCRIHYNKFAPAGISPVFAVGPHHPQTERTGGWCGYKQGPGMASKPGLFLIIQPCIQYSSIPLRSAWAVSPDLP